jgi:flagellar hook-basal body complex protein FliE
MNSIAPLSAIQPNLLAGKATAVTQSSGFGNALDDALKTVSKLQSDSSQMTRQLQMDNPGITLEETMIAMQKSSLSFQAVVQVRNRLVSAYNEISNMQV